MVTIAPTRQPPVPGQQLAQPVYVITEDDKKRQVRIADAWKAYHGDLPKPLERMPGTADDNVLDNRCKPAVRAGVRFLFGKELDISIDENAPQEAQDFLDTTWGEKETRIPLLQKMAMNGAMAGSAFLRIVPNSKGDAFRLIPVDPAIVAGIQTAPQDCDTVLLYCIQYSQTEPVSTSSRTVYYREEIQRIDPDGNATKEMMDEDDTWQIQHWTQVAASANMEPKQNNWTPAGEPIIWPYPFPPLFHCQNMVAPNDVWGEPDIAPDAIGLNTALNLTLSNVNRIEKLYGQPLLWATGVGESAMDIRPGRVTILPPTPESKMGSVPLVSDVPNALVFSKDLRSDMDEVFSVPGVASARIEVMPRGAMSGIAIELLFMPLLMKTEEKRCLYGELIIDVSKALLVLNKMSGDIGITLAWQNPLPHDDLVSVQTAIAKKELGMTNTSLLRQLGEDPDEEAMLATSDTEMVLASKNVSALPPETPGTPLLPGQQPPPKPGVPPTAPQPPQGGGIRP